MRKFPESTAKKITTAEEVSEILEQLSVTTSIGAYLCRKCKKLVVFHTSKKPKTESKALGETSANTHCNLTESRSHDPFVRVTRSTESSNEPTALANTTELGTRDSTVRVTRSTVTLKSESQKTDSQVSSQSYGSDNSYRPPSVEENGVDYVTLPIPRCSITERSCIICGVVGDRARITFEARLHCYRQMQLYIPQGARACSEHYLNGRIYLEDLRNIKSYSKTSEVPVDEVTKLIQGLSIESNQSLLNEAGAFQLSEDRLKSLTGFSLNNLQKLCFALTSMNNSHNRTVTEALITFLFKLRSGASNNTIATIFKFDNDQLVSEICSNVITCFEKDILPTLFGVKKHMTAAECIEARQNLIKNHTSQDAKKLLQLTGDELVLIFDGTYVKHQKSFNNEYQRHAFSGQKKAPLIKPFTVCTTNGFIVDICGPYEGTKNDAEIMKKVLADPNSVFRLMKEGDIMIVDRGFRNVVKLLEDKKFVVLMPALKGKRKQLPTAEANSSRIVTKLRWVIEAVHGQIKLKFKLLHHNMDNKMLPKAKSLCRIACYLNNKFGKRFKTDDKISDEIINKMLNPTFTENTLAEEVTEAGWSRKIKNFQKLSATDLVDFPEMSERDFKILFSGTYQLAMAISYLAEMLDEEGNLQLKYLKEHKNIISVLVRSRHVNRKVYKCYIDYKPDTFGLNGIQRYTCDCPNGLRTVGCCCHVAAVIYYLALARYDNKIFKPAEKLTTLFREEGVDLASDICDEIETEKEVGPVEQENITEEDLEEHLSSDIEDDCNDIDSD
ncbi:uncharacterized protein LOC131675604 [Phymastichus coffea]|uniref:uncharacterized protein LOC131675604 n=1 Tax=Phymastichus coffea TaxID=108790 RepID=UPI00273C9F8F|nr:uncharacterized protein LOC131675604 [Phymastichus coffea]